MSEINVLSKEVSELIAAGEVIDRPASIIKELLENAIDAKADVITVEIKNGGRTYIRVTDNGKGISSNDVRTAFLRHATSKISSKDDLTSIFTLGFRGEALASISAVSKVDVLTKKKNERFGTHYVIEGSEEKLCEESGCPNGTTFVVRDIFYNVPARLKFLKKDVSEGNNVANIVSKIALSHPEISFKFIRDNRCEIVTAGDCKYYSAIYAVMGREFASTLIPLTYSQNGVKISGYISKPLQSRSNRKFQNFFVNGRYIKSKTCSNALEEGYRNQIMTGKFPACVLSMGVAPSVLDVNVHPTKIEVRFSDEKLIYESVYFAVKNALYCNDTPVEMSLDDERHYSDRDLYDLPPKPQGEQLKFAVKNEYDTPDADSCIDVPPAELPESVPDSIDDDLFLASLEGEVPDNGENIPPEDIEQYSEINIETIDYDEVMREAEMNKGGGIPLELIDEGYPFDYHDEGIAHENLMREVYGYNYISDESFQRHTEILPENEIEEPVRPIVVGELFKTFIVAQAGNDMVLIDKHAAHERYIFEQIKDNANELDTQLFLEPIIVLLSYDEYDALSLNLDKTLKLGFDIELDVAPSVAVKGVPLVLKDENPTDIVTELAKNFLEYKHNPQLEIFDELYHSIACKAAIKANDYSDLVELQALVDKIYNNDDIRYCPHGRPVMIRLSKRDIEKQFKRIV